MAMIDETTKWLNVSNRKCGPWHDCIVSYGIVFKNARYNRAAAVLRKVRHEVSQSLLITL
jgi:hypothetical protein